MLQIRNATPDDRDQIAEILKEAFDDDVAPTSTFGDVLETMKGMGEQCLVIVEDTQVLGTVTYSMRMRLSGQPLASVKTLAVARDARRRGVGSSLLAACAVLSRESGCADLRVCPSDDGVRSFYHKCGFKEVSWQGVQLRTILDSPQ